MVMMHLDVDSTQRLLAYLEKKKKKGKVYRLPWRHYSGAGILGAGCIPNIELSPPPFVWLSSSQTMGTSKDKT